ncbi:hypothetical protein F5B19DRAFT_505444 [Rostrohypoxylon terebratum]|nr:hypothetical protein F5B19DRAFT_505444 [Rostrohypoxylon terebratum]
MESQPAPTTDWDPIVEQIRKQHLEGPPFFSRSMLQRVALQIQLYNNGMLDGKPYMLETIKGDVIIIEAKPDVESEIFKDVRCNHGDRKQGPYIYYRTVQSMLSHQDMKKFHPEAAFLPLVVMFPKKPGRCLGHHHNHKEGEPNSSFSPTELTNIINNDRQAWESSLQYAFFKGILKMYQERLVNVDKVIAFGCGNLSTGRTACDYSTAQHALVFSIQKILSRLHSKNITVHQGFRQIRNEEPVDLVVRAVLQDPAYTPVEEQVLTSMGMEIVKDPDGFVLLDDKSFVVSIDLNTPVQQIMENLARPIAIIQMTHVDELNGAKVEACTDPSSERVDNMLRNEYELMKLTMPKQHRNICLYVRK